MMCGDLHPYFDGELDLRHTAEFEAHLAECPACSAQLERLQALRSAIRSGAPYYTAPVRRRTATVWIGALAAAALISVLVFRPAGSSRLEDEVISAHLRSLQANHLVDVPSSDRHTVKPWFTGKLDFAPDVIQPAGFELVGGRMDYLDGRSVAALVYKRRQHTINLFIWPGAGSGHAPQALTRNGFHILHWSHGGMHCWAISDVAEQDLKDLAAAIS